MFKCPFPLGSVLLALAIGTLPLQGAVLGSAFSYAGRLLDHGNPADGVYDFRFRLYDAADGGHLAASGVTNAAVSVTQGLFRLELDFGPGVFNGPPYWLDVAVRTNQSTTDFVSLTPRQAIAPVPYALYAPPTSSAVTNSEATAVTGVSTNGNGVYGESRDGIGVFGSSISNDGVHGASQSGDGVVGVSAQAYGVRGIGLNTGVYAHNSGAALAGNDAYLATPNYSGEFHGDVVVFGNLTKNGGSFRIDHPLDPANKYLAHSFVESPDMKNIYDGTMVLDDHGEALVELPAWFDALNKDFRYQLPPIGAPAPNLHIAQKITANRFRIAGGPPSLEVSWQVTGTRKDTWANAHRIQVEQDKPQAERGRYLVP